MRARSTTAALTALAVTGCWPVIPGKADDYVIPETALVTGTFTQITPVGDYWEDNTPFGSALWGVFAAPQPVTGTEFWGPAGTCTRNPTTLDNTLTLLRAGGSGTSRLLHDDAEVRLTWNESAAVFIANVVPEDFVADTPYDLAPVEFAELGSLEIAEFFTTPDTDLVVTSPVIDAPAAPSVTGPEGLAFTWTGKKSDYVGITTYAFDVEQQLLEEVTCLVEDTGTFTIPPELYLSTPQTSYVSVVISSINLKGGMSTMGGVDQGYVTASAYGVQGAVLYGAEAAP